MIRFVLLILGLFVFFFLSLAIVCDWKNCDTSERLKVLCISAGFTAILISIGMAITIRDIHEWNDGICSDCGGHYQFVEAIGHRRGTSYLYGCDKCENRIELNIYEKPVGE